MDVISYCMERHMRDYGLFMSPRSEIMKEEQAEMCLMKRQ
jgi:hypothetical protein